MYLKFFKTAIHLIKETFKEFQKDHVVVLSAAIAFYTIFSLPGILIIIIRVTSLFFSEQQIKTAITDQLTVQIGKNVADEIRIIVDNATLDHTSPLWTVIGLGLVLFSASSVFTIIQTAMNTIWGVRARPKKNWLKIIINRLLSLMMVILLSALMLISLSLDLVTTLFKDNLKYVFSGNTATVLAIISALFSTMVVALIFGIIFKALPDAKIRWRDVGIGTLATTLLFTLGKYLIGLYLSASDFGSSYGAAGSIVLLLIWVNYSSMIMLLGGEFTQVYTRYLGRKIMPAKNAVKIQINEVQISGKDNIPKVKRVQD